MAHDLFYFVCAFFGWCSEAAQALAIHPPGDGSRSQTDVARMRVEVTSVDVDGATFDITSAGREDVKGEVLMVYTTSGSARHIDSFCTDMEILNNASIPDIFRSATVLLFDNGGINKSSEGMQLSSRSPQLPGTPTWQDRRARSLECFRILSNRSKMFYMTSRNTGFRMGAVQAMDIMASAELFDGYAWVIHQHPDVFMIYGERIADTLNTTATALGDHIFFANVDKTCLYFDWFAFRPERIRRSAFHAWKTYDGFPECYLSESAFNGTDVAILARNSGPGYRGIDQAGLWHSHNVTDVRRWIGLPDSPWSHADESEEAT